ncbi:hypothetical protein ACW2QC_07340 [Virgibacillus sp. FSP13]
MKTSFRRGVDVMRMKNVPVSFNLDDPEQKRLYNFLTRLPNGKRRNASGYLKRLVDRDYQIQKNEDIKQVSSKGNGGIKLTL